MSITVTQLRSFIAVVRTGSVTAAADELVVTQPSVSAAIAGLAREVGTPLLERDGRGVRPTKAGKAFAPFAADVIGLLEEGRRAAGRAAANSGLALRIAAVTTAAESFVPGVMGAFASANPDVHLMLQVGNREHVVALVLDHKADVAFVGRPPVDERVESFTLRPNRPVLITSQHDKLAGRREVPPHELAARHWLLREPGSGTRVLNEQFLAASHLDVPTLTVGSNGAIKQAARAGLGVSFVSRDAVAAEIDAGTLGVIGVVSPPADRQWHLMRSRVGPQRPGLELFLDFVRADASAGQ